MEKKLTDFEKIILSSIQEGIHTTIWEKLKSYDSPLKKLIDDAFKVHDTQLREIVYSALSQTLEKKEFVEAVRQAFDHKIARAMVDHLTSTIDHAINAIRSDPTIKAKMVLAIEAIINENQPKKGI